MTLSAKVSGVWQTITDPQAKVSGAWQPVQQVYAKVSGVWQMIYSRFTPVTHLWTPSNVGPGLPGLREYVPENATHVRITLVGGGGGGGGSGGGGGGMVIKDLAISSADWPSGSNHYILLNGQYPTGGDGSIFEAGNFAYVDGTLASGAIPPLQAFGGAFSGAGGTATGGDTNISGGNGTGVAGGTGAGGGPAGNGGSPGGGGGADGYWKFEWT